MTVVAPPLTVEVLSFSGQSGRATEYLRAFSTRTGSAAQCVPTTSFQGGADVLLLWGPGAPDRFEPMRRQIAAGGHVVAVDLAYWHREAKARISIDAAHPQAFVMRQACPSTRLDEDGITLEDRWNPDGPIVIAGIGRKAKVQYGEAVDHWEAEMAAACRAQWPTRPVVYRPKRAADVWPSWATARTSHQSIDAVLGGASLVITWHSNVAVDAIRLGIPVVCHDGAAAAVSPSVVPVAPRPLSVEQRRQFLSNLAWFQWAPQEAAPMWTFVSELLR